METSLSNCSKLVEQTEVLLSNAGLTFRKTLLNNEMHFELRANSYDR
jgi:hypothetical protein